MKKIFYLVFILAFGLMVTGCESKKADVVFWHTMGKENQNVLNEIIKDFNELHPEIKIEHQQKGGYDELLSAIRTALPAGNEPNMSFSYTDHVAAYNSGANIRVKELSSFIDDPTHGFTDDEKADFVESYFDEGSVYQQEGIYSLPFSKSTELMFYNKTFFDKHNLTVPKTWAETAATAQQIRDIIDGDASIKDKDKVYPIGYDSAANLFITASEQKNLPYTVIENGEGKVLFADKTKNAGTKEMMQYFDDLYTRKLFVTKQELGGSYTSDLFIEQKLFMSIGSTAGVKYNEPVDRNKEAFEVGIAPIPQFDSENVKMIQQGPNINMFDKDEKSNLNTWKFMKFLVSPEVSAKYAAFTGYAPVRKSSYQTAVYQERLKQVTNPVPLEALKAKVAMIYEEISQFGFVSPAFDRSSNARLEVDKVFNQLFTNKEYHQAATTAEKKLEIIQDILEKAYNRIVY